MQEIEHKVDHFQKDQHDAKVAIIGHSVCTDANAKAPYLQEKEGNEGVGHKGADPVEEGVLPKGVDHGPDRHADAEQERQNGEDLVGGDVSRHKNLYDI